MILVVEIQSLIFTPMTTVCQSNKNLASKYYAAGSWDEYSHEHSWAMVSTFMKFVFSLPLYL